MFSALLNNKLSSFIIVSLLSSLLAFTLIKSGLLDNIEKRTWDWRVQALANRTTADPKIKLILIDQASLEFFAEHESIFWPWPRSIYSRIVDFLKLAGAKVVAFDIMFSESSLYGQEDDLILAESMNGSLPVVAASALIKSQTKEDPLRFEILKEKQNKLFEISRKYKLISDDQIKSVTLPIESILKNSIIIGNVSSENDSDAVFRYGSAGSYYKGLPVLSLPFAVYEAAGLSTELSALPYNDNDQLPLRFAALKNSFSRYSFAAIYSSINRIEQGMEPQVSPEEFKDSYVFVGMSAPGLLDLRPTPLNPQAPGVEVNATTLDNLLNNKFIRQLSWSYSWIFASAFILISSAVVFFSRSAGMQSLLCIMAQLALIISTFALAFSGFWIQLVPAVVTAFIATLLSVAEQYRLEGAQSRFIKKAFKYYVSPEVIEKIISNPTILKLGGDKRELSIFFCDIKGFTKISESMDPATLVLFLNKFLSAMTSIILKHGGTVDKYVGDAIVAFWNAPLPVDDHAIKSVQASIECQQVLAEMRDSFKKEFGVDVYLRIGLNTGTVSVGNFGSAERFNYTVIGDAANLASRLEGANKLFDTDILFAEETNTALKNSIQTVRLAKIKVVGKARPIWVYTSNRLFSDEQLLLWEKFLQAFDQGDLESAKKIISELPEIKLTGVYKNYIQEFSTGQEWTGILELSEK